MADGSKNLWTGLLKYSKNRGVFCHVTNDEMDFSEVISGDMPSCSFSGNLNVLFKRNKIHLVLRDKIHKHFGSLYQGFLSSPVVLTLEALISKFKFSFLVLYISYRSSGEKLFGYQENSSCVIMSLILMTFLIDKALILQGEI